MRKTIFFLLFGALTVSPILSGLAQAQPVSGQRTGSAQATQCRCLVNFEVENITSCNISNGNLTIPLDQSISVRNTILQILPNNILCRAAVAVLESQLGISDTDQQTTLSGGDCLALTRSFNQSVPVAGAVQASIQCSTVDNAGNLIQAASGGASGDFVGPPRPASDDLVGELRGQISELNRLNTNDPAKLIGRIIKLILQVVGSLALLVFVYGGIMWMTARGNSERTQKAIKTLAWGGLGVAVILASYTLVEFIFGAVK